MGVFTLVVLIAVALVMFLGAIGGIMKLATEGFALTDFLGVTILLVVLVTFLIIIFTGEFKVYG